MLALPIAQAAPREGDLPAPAAAEASRLQLVVTTASDTPDVSAGELTLRDALSQAAKSALPARIEFDAAALGNVPIRLSRALTVDAGRAPIHIDASRSKTPVTIDASGCPDAGIIVGNASDLTITNLSIRGGRQRVLLCKDRARLALHRVTVTDGSMPGLAAFGQGRVVITDSRLTGNSTHGLELHGDCTGRLENVDLSRNGQSGIAGFDRTKVQAVRCRLDANSEWGVVLNDQSGAELTGCTIKKSRFANCDVSGSTTVVMNGCELLEGQRFGLFATGHSTVQLRSTRIAASGSRGIEAQDEASLTLAGSRIESSADYGLILFGQTRVQASECFFNNNAAHGASLRGSAAGQFTRCSFVGNRFSGLGCLDGSDGGSVSATQCIFRQNGMRPIYRGPFHLDPLVPTPVRVEGSRVHCLAEPGATIELYLDRAGEASRYLTSVEAGRDGRFEIDTALAPPGYVITAAATASGATSEFNVIAGSTSAPTIDALLGRTGPLSDEAGEINLDMLVRRWRPDAQIVFQLDEAPSAAVERYVRVLNRLLPEWTGRRDNAPRLAIGNRPAAAGATVIPVRYMDADAQQLASRGGVTYMRWDSSGFFIPPMEIMLALGRETQETCPRVLAHEMGHALGLCHARVGLLSRMQGSAPPGAGYVNDFSPMMTYYDVLALQALHDPRNTGALSLRQLVQRGAIPAATAPQIAEATSATLAPSFSPPADPLQPMSNDPNGRP
jgi:hypothetical protein